MAIHVKSHIPHLECSVASTMEVTAIRVMSATKTFTLCSLYIPPILSVSQIKSELIKIREALSIPILICADVNAYHTSWGSEYTNARGRYLSEFSEENNLVILNTGEPTFLSPQGRYSHIDLTFSDSSLVTHFNWEVHPCLYHSDHFPIIISSEFPSTPKSVAKKWILGKADWSAFQSTLQLPLQFESPSVACSEMVGRLEAAAALSVPRTTGKVTRSVAHCWWTEACSTALKQKHRTYNRYKRHKGDMKYFIEYKKARAIFRHTILTARRTSWQSFVSAITVKTSSNEVWKKVRKLKGKPPNKAVVLIKEGNYISEPISIADLFARDF